MPGPLPAANGVGRSRKRAPVATLRPPVNPVIPPLPFPDPHPLAASWWQSVWRGGMASEYDEADRHGLAMLAFLIQDYLYAATPRERRELSAEIRMVSARYGLSPIDRRKMAIEVERPEDIKPASRRPTTRRSTKAVADPRAVLYEGASTPTPQKESTHDDDD